ncbi:MAG: hypothetical protein NT113_10410 [Hyphomicrobiales bacterium]|jgi:hypothetical protein|nr:hypothetical protein [Hyphomicrobiales bacterium]
MSHSSFGRDPSQISHDGGFGLAGMGAGAMIGGALLTGVMNYNAAMRAHRARVARAEQAGLFAAASEALRKRDYEARRTAERRAEAAELRLARHLAAEGRAAVSALRDR